MGSCHLHAVAAGDPSARSWAVSPRKTTWHSLRECFAILRQMLPAQATCWPPSGLVPLGPASAGALEPPHIRDSACRISGEFAMNPVSFMTGSPLQGPFNASPPYSHWSPRIMSTQAMALKRFVQSRSHEDALRRWSCRKY